MSRSSHPLSKSLPRICLHMPVAGGAHVQVDVQVLGPKAQGHRRAPSGIYADSSLMWDFILYTV